MSSKKRRTHGNPANQGQPKPKQANRNRAVAKPNKAGQRPGAFDAYAAIEQTPPSGALYSQVLRTADHVWWRSLLGVLMAISLYILLSAVISQAIVMLSWTITSPGIGFAEYSKQALGFELPAGMLAQNLGIAALIPISFATIMLVHHVRPRWLGSVQPRLRWKFVWISLGVAALAFAAVHLASIAAGPAVHVRPQQHFWLFAIVIILTSPLQAIGEEYLFRGYLLQAFGSLVKNPWFGVIVSSLVFALFHGTQNLPLFIDRFAFGLLAAMLVMRTGGIEAGVGAHVINNVYAWFLAGLTSTIATSRNLQEIGWVSAAVDVGGFALFAVLAYLAGRKLKLRTLTP
ncbi:CPBP family intramembrane metalloprotease [Microlunatus elymi]|uniref:CPBP family intramembrane metalloprotease n=1 Tax=Microlunatus elymi TaxID=2596828 RepID=A0A516Q1D9_9ACTN|nr:type II CAAX endopeptidase family protein [Microlunatus elymi]QDP97243.1 CPBP family intramembrane metalloprotease [Microlunatus elymi]